MLAGGSNVVIADDGRPGHGRARAHARDRARRRRCWSSRRASRGTTLVAHCVDEGLQGFECLSGIPGSTGATPIQNVGAYGQDVAETVEWVRVYDRETDAVETIDAAECGFEYRRSIFKYRDRWTVLAVAFRLRESELSGPLRYAELARTLDVPVGEPRAAGRRPRGGARPAPRQGDGDRPRRPGLGQRRLVLHQPDPRPRSVFDDAPRPPPAFPEPDGRIKTSAAWLIERAGLHARATATAAPGISTKHTLALVNRGGATTAELMALAPEIAAGVRETFGITLTPEPVLVGHRW